MHAPEQPAEFVITESPRAIPALPEAGSENPWAAVRQLLDRFETEAVRAKSAMDKAASGQQSTKRKLLLGLIEEVMDNLDRSLSPEEEAGLEPGATRWFKKLQRTRRSLEELLVRERVVPLDAEQLPPGLCKIADVEERSDLREGQIARVLVRGYLWNGELLRKAEVIVARNRVGASHNTATSNDKA
jgi:molecular chaperone GrpE (heat shock protein)